VGDAAGSKTQVTGLVAAVAIAGVLLFFTGPLQFVPTAALGAVLVKAALSLIDVKTMKALYRMDRKEFAISLLATVGVVAVGAIQAILVAVGLAVIRFVRLVSRPKIELLGVVENLEGFHAVDRHENAKTIPGLCCSASTPPLSFLMRLFSSRRHSPLRTPRAPG